MSTTSRSSRATSSRTTSSSWLRSAGSSTRSSVSTAERSEASGFLSSWVTSAAKASVASIRWRRLWVMSCSARASRPISSRRAGRTRHVDLARPAEPDPVRGEREPAQRIGDGPREEARQQDREDDGAEQDQGQREALGPHHAADVAGVDGEQQHVPGPIDPHRGADIGRAVGRAAQLGDRPCAGQRPDCFRPGGERVDRRRHEDRRPPRADDRVEAVVEAAGDAAIPGLGRRIAQLVGRRRTGPAVGTSRAAPAHRPAAGARLSWPSRTRIGWRASAGSGGEHVGDHHRLGSAPARSAPGSAGCGSCRDRRGCRRGSRSRRC